MAPMYANEQIYAIWASYTQTKVIYLETLQRGDHIAWEKCLGVYDHHGIVVGVNKGENELDVIHNTVAKEGKAANGGHKCKILRGKVKVDLSKEVLYLCNYKSGGCFEPDDVIANAESLLGKRNYHLLLNNCEHFATFCKTQRGFSGQVASLCISVVIGVKGGLEMELKNSVVGDIYILCATSQKHLTATAIKTIGIGGAVAINLAVECVVFGVKTYNAYKECENGDITRNEFWAKTADAGCLSVIRFACTTVGGLIGQSVIPIPLLGGLIGCAIGAVAGHFLGKIAGRLCSKAILKK